MNVFEHRIKPRRFFRKLKPGTHSNTKDVFTDSLQFGRLNNLVVLDLRGVKMTCQFVVAYGYKEISGATKQSPVLQSVFGCNGTSGDQCI